MKICILGAGTWGTALAYALSGRKEDIWVWSKFEQEARQLDSERRHPNLQGLMIPQSIRFTSDAAEAAADADYLFVVVPSIYVRNTVREFAPLTEKKTIVISAAKGIETDTLMTLTEVIEDELETVGKHNPVVALSGPTHAEEVAQNMPTLIVSACNNIHAATAVQTLFDGTCIRPYANSDVKGVQICGALKNVEALAVGIARGLGYGDNTRAAMITRGMEEIRRLGIAMGCNERTFFGLAGIGDLIVTATSEHSRNNRAGFLIGKGRTVQEAKEEVGMVVEGMNALPAAVRLCRMYGMDMPLIDAVRAVVLEEKAPEEIVRDLMQRKLKMEY